MTDENNSGHPLRALPKMDVLLGLFPADVFPRRLVKYCASLVLEGCRASGRVLTLEEAAEETKSMCSSIWDGGIVSVINATGVVSHTNLGRSPIDADEASDAVRAACGSCLLEYDSVFGSRGDRYARCAGFLRILTGAEDALIVNNNAAAVFLIASAFASGKEIIVSRGELVEIGGLFRMPDVIASAGAGLREVGATNKTYARDYENAVSSYTGFIMKVSKSNYRIEGFAEEVHWRDIPPLADKRGLLSFYDAGSALFTEIPGVSEPPASELVSSGFGLVSFSGDKLMGSVQCGVILGRRAYVERLKKHPAVRMLRPDKITLALLESTLRTYIKGGEPLAVKMLKTSPEELKRRAEYLRGKVGGKVAEYSAPAGGGSVPGLLLPGYALELDVPSPEKLAGLLRTGNPPVAVCLRCGRVIAALRSVAEAELEPLAAALENALNSVGIRPRL